MLILFCFCFVFPALCLVHCLHLQVYFIVGFQRLLTLSVSLKLNCLDYSATLTAAPIIAFFSKIRQTKVCEITRPLYQGRNLGSALCVLRLSIPLGSRPVLTQTPHKTFSLRMLPVQAPCQREEKIKNRTDMTLKTLSVPQCLHRQWLQ